MKQGIFTITENVNLTADIMQMKLSGDTSDIINPGQFVNIKIEGLFLRRPISVCDVENGVLTLIYRIVGEGTLVLSKMKEGNKLDILTGLGNGYDLTLSGDQPLLIGGGVGVPPLYISVYFAIFLIPEPNSSAKPISLKNPAISGSIVMSG